ncbi:MAG TPA: NAD(P)/FAD-dependent oxidoreductase [Nocardioidaceae bacterium]|nr:NAD(P)/FAD-dependent oxidoreductase [Nocardioidaceae bacterium]
MNEYDVAVIGGGAAGLSAALVLTRARRRVLVVDAGEPRNAPATAMHGFLSRDGLPPADLIARGRKEVAMYGGQLADGFVDEVRAVASGFELVLADHRAYRARRVLVTTGLRDVLPDVPGLRERWGIDLLHCPYCHGYEVRDQALGVLGGTPDSVAHALLIRQWSDDVVYFDHGSTLTDLERAQLEARSICVASGTVRRLVVEEDRLAGVELGDGNVVPRDAVFVRPRLVPQHSLLVALGCAVDDTGWTVTDRTGRTRVPGVWAAGNATNPRAQVITAAGEGSAAAIAINADLVDEDVRNAVPRAELTA